MTDETTTALATIRELIQIHFEQKDSRLWLKRTSELAGALRAIRPQQARLLAGELWARYDHHDIDYFLGRLNTSFPGILGDLSPEFVMENLFRPPWLYLGAPASTTHLLVEALDALDPAAHGLRRNGLLLALAWVADDLARDLFRAWRENPPDWSSELFLAPHEYTVEAGWEVTAEGGRRDLYHHTCYELVLVDEPEFTPSAHAVAVSTPNDVSCGWCGRQLVTLLDIDLRDSRCAFLLEHVAPTDVTVTRLRIAHCPWCSAFATLYTDVDLQGGVAWSAANEAMPHILTKVGLGADMEPLPPASRRLALGPQRKTPYEALGRFMLDERGISQIGGHAEWIDDAVYPVCPNCQRRMTHIGQVSWEDCGDPYAEGCTYAFRCAPCGKAATTYQQS